MASPMSSHTITIAYSDDDGEAIIETSYLGGGDILLIKDGRGEVLALSQEGALALIEALSQLTAVRAELRPIGE